MLYFCQQLFHDAFIAGKQANKPTYSSPAAGCMLNANDDLSSHIKKVVTGMDNYKWHFLCYSKLYIAGVKRLNIEDLLMYSARIGSIGFEPSSALCSANILYDGHHVNGTAIVFMLG